MAAHPRPRAALTALLLAGAVAGTSGCVVEVVDATADPTADATATVPAEGGYAVLQTDDVTGDPVTYSSCRPIGYVTNLGDAPPELDDVVADAVAAVAEATGLTFVDEGPTDEEPAAGRDAEVAQYGDRWAPVLIAWTDPAAVPDLEGDTAGLGGSTAVSDGAGTTAYVSGDVLLDGPDLEDLLADDGGRDEVRAVLQHELAHLVGLDHVDDPTQLMHAEASPDVTDFQAGDLAGLALMGAGACAEELAEPDGSG